MLINAGADVNLQDHRSNTALILASSGSHTKIVELLIEAGAKEFVDVDENYQEKIDKYLSDGFPLSYKISVNDLVQILGEPVQIDERDEESIHNPEIINKFYRITYDDKFFEIAYLTNSDRYFTIYKKISSNEFECMYDISIGTSKDNLIKTFGEPEYIEDNRYIYIAQMGDLYTVELTFEVVNDYISTIIWYTSLD